MATLVKYHYLPLYYHLCAILKACTRYLKQQNTLFTSPETIFIIVSLKPSNSRYHITKGYIFCTFGFFEKCNPLCNPFNGLHFLHFWFLNVCVCHTCYSNRMTPATMAMPIIAFLGISKGS
mgnify:CR=1 FL=1